MKLFPQFRFRISFSFALLALLFTSCASRLSSTSELGDLSGDAQTQDLWKNIQLQFPLDSNSLRYPLLTLGEMDAWGNYYFLAFEETLKNSKTVYASFHSSTRNANGIRIVHSFDLGSQDSLYSVLNGSGISPINLENHPCWVRKHPPLPDASMFFVEYKLENKLFAFRGNPCNDVRRNLIVNALQRVKRPISRH